MSLEGFKFDKLGIFQNFNQADSSAIVHLHDNGTVVGYGGQQGFTNWKVRDITDKEANNAARSALLVALGKAAGVLNEEDYCIQQDGRTQFTKTDFIARLKQKLGPEVVKALKMDGITNTFKMKDGYLVSGRPLTERRITSLMNALYKETATERPANVPTMTAQGEARTRFNAETETFKNADASFLVRFFKDQVNFQDTDENAKIQRDAFQNIFAMTDGAGNELATSAFHVLCDKNTDADLFERALTIVQQGVPKLAVFAKNIVGTIPKEARISDASLATLRKLATASKGVNSNKNQLLFKKNIGELPRWKCTFNNFLRKFSLIESYPNLNAGIYLKDVRKEVELHALRRMHGQATALDWIRTFATSTRLKSQFQVIFRDSEWEAAVGKSVLQTLNVKPSVIDQQMEEYAKAVFTMIRDSVTEAMDPAAPDDTDENILTAVADKFLVKLRKLASTDNTFAEALSPKKLTADDALNGLAGMLFAHRGSTIGCRDFDTAFVQVGGGLPQKANFTFQLGANQQTYDSHVNSFASVCQSFGVTMDDALQSGRTPPLTGLSQSEITLADSQKPLITFSRFGSIGSVGINTDEQYRQLAAQTFLLNPALVEQALAKQVNNKREIDVPIFRVDMGERDDLTNRNSSNQIGDTVGSFSLTIKPPKTDSNAPDPEPVTVTLNPRVVKFRLPTDSVIESKKHNHVNRDGCKIAYKIGNTKTCEENLILMGSVDYQKTECAMKSLATEVDKYVANTNVPNREIVKQLWKDVEKAFMEIENHKVTDKDDLDKDRIRWYAGCGADMQRLGARIALLVAKMGHVPAINCRWGRDRTGAMDNEIKMLAVKLHNGQELGSIMLGDKADGNVELRTDMLEKTGNAKLAHAVNGTIHPLNRDQSGGLAGIPSLFKQEKNDH